MFSCRELQLLCMMRGCRWRCCLLPLIMEMAFTSIRCHCRRRRWAKMMMHFIHGMILIHIIRGTLIVEVLGAVSPVVDYRIELHRANPVSIQQDITFFPAILVKHTLRDKDHLLLSRTQMKSVVYECCHLSSMITTNEIC